MFVNSWMSPEELLATDSLVIPLLGIKLFFLVFVLRQK